MTPAETPDAADAETLDAEDADDLDPAAEADGRPLPPLGRLASLTPAGYGGSAHRLDLCGHLHWLGELVEEWDAGRWAADGHRAEVELLVGRVVCGLRHLLKEVGSDVRVESNARSRRSKVRAGGYTPGRTRPATATDTALAYHRLAVEALGQGATWAAQYDWCLAAGLDMGRWSEAKNFGKRVTDAMKRERQGPAEAGRGDSPPGDRHR